SRNRLQQLIVAHRIGQEIDRTSLHRPNAGRNVAETGDEDHRSLDAFLQQRGLKLEPVEIGHRNIEDGTTRNRRVMLGQKLLRPRSEMSVSTVPLPDDRVSPASSRCAGGVALMASMA